MGCKQLNNICTDGWWHGLLKKDGSNQPSPMTVTIFVPQLKKNQTFSQLERSYYCQLRSDWLVFFFWLRNGSGKIVIVEGWFVTSFDRHIDIFIPMVIKNVRKVPKRIFLANGFTLRDVSRNFLVLDWLMILKW